MADSPHNSSDAQDHPSSSPAPSSSAVSSSYNAEDYFSSSPSPSSARSTSYNVEDYLSFSPSPSSARSSSTLSSGALFSSSLSPSALSSSSNAQDNPSSSPAPSPSARSSSARSSSARSSSDASTTTETPNEANTHPPTETFPYYYGPNDPANIISCDPVTKDLTLHYTIKNHSIPTRDKASFIPARLYRPGKFHPSERLACYLHFHNSTRLDTEDIMCCALVDTLPLSAVPRVAVLGVAVLSVYSPTPHDAEGGLGSPYVRHAALWVLRNAARLGVEWEHVLVGKWSIPLDAWTAAEAGLLGNLG
ncbi:hypothetical protein B0T17DRAFT_505630 [Bombardia bombarda]|uniref:Uncharacterized protein n=1 Tax=Bombardia bombarda TaxID=252184 RepID=A0AA39X814_9PEZI|nr:hypothetical protein B0T17DRAFT_505630 [Bombardia bombarda]